MAGNTTDWFIIRTAGRSTLRLASTLNEDGFEAWAPELTITIRIPKRKDRRDEIKLPLLPSFIFVRAAHLVDMLRLARMPVKPRRGEGWGRPAHRDFSVFHYLDQIPLIADRDLEPMRNREAQAGPKKGMPSFPRGSRVRVNSGAFEGLRGRVEHCKSGYAVVIFTDFRRPVKIPTFLLRDDESLIGVTSAAIAA